MHAAEHAHSTAASAIRHLLQPTILSYYSLVFFRHRASTASFVNTPPSMVRARSSSTRPPSVFSAPLPHLPRTPRRHRLAIGALQHTLVRPPAAFHWIFLQTLDYTIRFQDQFTACLPHIFAEHHVRIGVSATPRSRDICSQGIIGLSRTCPFVLLSLPVNVFLEFLSFFMGFVSCALTS